MCKRSTSVLVAVTVLCATAAAASPPVPVRATATVEGSVADCKRRAVDKARVAALEKLPHRIMSAFVRHMAYQDDTARDTVQDYALQVQRGFVALEHGAKDFVSKIGEGGAIVCTLSARATLLASGTPDPTFHFKNATLDRPSYWSGDSAKVTFELSRDGWVYILGVGADNSLVLVRPNAHEPAPLRARAGKTVDWPDDKSRQHGIDLKAVLPEGAAKAVEVLHLIAVRDKRDLFTITDGRPQKVGPYKVYSLGSLDTALRRLAHLPASAWTMRIIPYEIRRRP